MNIYLPIEVKVRELEGKVLLALTAAERGHTVILGNKKETINFAKEGKLPPGIVHDKSLTPGKYKIENYKQLKEHRHLITAQDEESGLLDESFDDFAKRRFSEETVSNVDRIFTWGTHDCRSLKSIYPKYSDKIVKTGSPRVDFWRKELDKYYLENDPDLGSYILVVSNFGYPIDENPFWNRIARLRKAGYFERDPKMEKYMYENTAYQFRLLYRFVEMIRQLSIDFPNTKIVVRPHPVDSMDAWQNLVEQKSNIIIKREDSISGWIRNANLIIHNGCTSALEAAVSGIPRIAYRPIPDDLERAIPNNVSLQAFSLEDLKKMVSDFLQKDSKVKIITSEPGNDIINSRLSSLTDKLAVEKIVDEWERIGQSTDLKSSTAEQLIESKPIDKKSFKKIIKGRVIQIRNFLINKDSNQKKNEKFLKTSHKFPSLTSDELEIIVDKLKNTLNRFNNVKITRYGEKSFIFSRDNSI